MIIRMNTLMTSSSDHAKLEWKIIPREHVDKRDRCNHDGNHTEHEFLDFGEPVHDRLVGFPFDQSLQLVWRPVLTEYLYVSCA